MCSKCLQRYCKDVAKKQNSADDRKYLGEIMAIDNPTAEDLGRMLSIAGEKDWNEY